MVSCAFIEHNGFDCCAGQTEGGRSINSPNILLSVVSYLISDKCLILCVINGLGLEESVYLATSSRRGLCTNDSLGLSLPPSFTV